MNPVNTGGIPAALPIPASVHSVHPAILPYFSAHYAMETQAHARFLQHLLSIPPETRLNLFDEESDEDDEMGGSSRGAANSKPKKPYQIVGGGIAVLPLVGVLQKNEDWFTRWYPGEATATSTFIAALKNTKADPDVTCRLVFSDSFGGMADGTPEAADAVYEARRDGKPIIAVSGGACCSAAYWICSQAQEFYAGPSDWLGSVGTRLRLIDSSAMYQTLGLLPVEITSGTYKAAGADGLPITERDRAYFQQSVDKMQERFTASVAKGRKLPIDDVRAIAKEARVYIGNDAQASGLVDDILSPVEVVQRLQKSGGKTAKSSAGTTSTTAAPSGIKERTIMSLSDVRKRVLAALEGSNDDETPAPAAVPTASTVPVAPTASAPHPVLAAALAAGVTTAEQFAEHHKKAQAHDGLKVKADAYDGMVTTQRTDTKKLLVALYPDATERAAEEAVIDALPAGVALDRYCKTVQASHDAKLGTSGTQAAPRLTQAPAASPKTIAAELSKEDADELDGEVTSSFDNSFGKKKGQG